jgi:hypothetical protein
MLAGVLSNQVVPAPGCSMHAQPTCRTVPIHKPQGSSLREGLPLVPSVVPDTLLLPLVMLQVYSLAQQNRFYKKAAGYCLRAVAK